MADGAGTGLSSTRTISSSFKPARAARESVRPVCVLPVSWRFFFCLKNLRLLHGYFCRATQESWPRFQDLELLWRRGRGQRQKPWPAACPRRRVCLDVSGMITFLFVFQCFLVVFFGPCPGVSVTGKRGRAATLVLVQRRRATSVLVQRRRATSVLVQSRRAKASRSCSAQKRSVCSCAAWSLSCVCFSKGVWCMNTVPSCRVSVLAIPGRVRRRRTP